MSRRDVMGRLQEAHDRLADQLERTTSDLGAALGIALVGLGDPEFAARQLEELVETAQRRSAIHGDLAPHCRTTSAVLAAKTGKTTTGPEPDGGA